MAHGFILELNQTPDEIEVLDHIRAAYKIIQGWGLGANQEELAHAVHTMQFFVMNHMLNRETHGEWSNWYRQNIGRNV